MGILREPMEVESDSDEDYSLDNIVERQVLNGEMRYFLKWKCKKTERKLLKRDLECPVNMDSFEKLSRERKLSKNEIKDKKQVNQSCTASVVSDTEETEKKKAHSKSCKGHSQAKKDSEEAHNATKQTVSNSEECGGDEQNDKTLVADSTEASDKC